LPRKRNSHPSTKKKIRCTGVPGSIPSNENN
jgi:hypothetical protein